MNRSDIGSQAAGVDPGRSAASPGLDEPAATPVPTSTSSRLTRVLGAATLVGLVATLAFGLVFSGPEVNMRDSVRLFYIHVPSILTAYVAFGITLIGSVQYLRNRSRFWDLMAGAAAEIGVVFLAIALITGSLWGRPTWGTYWVWDPRLTSTALMFLMYIGYLAVRRLDMPADVRSQRAAILGIVSIVNVVIVHYSVAWWRSLHQARTFGMDTQMDGLMLFSFFLGLVTFTLMGAWLLVHRFRLAWLESENDRIRIESALVERRDEARRSVAATGSGFVPTDRGDGEEDR